MVPRIGKPGRSFRGASLYFAHDQGTTETAERVGWTHVLNSPSDDPDKTVKWMIVSHYAANNHKEEENAPGRRIEKPVWTWSLALHPDQGDPGQEYWLTAAKSFLTEFGLQDHPTVLYSHTDEQYSHIHGMTTLIDPATNRTKADEALSKGHLKASRWAQKWEETEGKVYCAKRAQNNARRDNGEYVKYKDPELELKPLITRLYNGSDNGRAFQAALEGSGFKLAMGGSRIVIVDPNGKIHSISRQIEGAKAKDIKMKLAGLELPDVEQVRLQLQNRDDRDKNPAPDHDPERQQEKPVADPAPSPAPQTEKPAPEYLDRDQQDREWQESIIDAGIQHEQERREALGAERKNRAQDRRLAEWGDFYEENSQARSKLQDKLQAAYGERERRLRQEIDQLDTTLKNSGRLKLWWLKLRGRVSKTAEQDLADMRRSLENLEWRKKEATDTVEQRIAQERQRIAARHEKQVRPFNQPKVLDRQPEGSQRPPALPQGPVPPSRDFGNAARGAPPGNDNSVEQARRKEIMEHMQRMQDRRSRGPSRGR